MRLNKLILLYLQTVFINLNKKVFKIELLNHKTLKSMKPTTTRVILFSLIAFFVTSTGAFGQTYEKYYQDGQLFVKFNDNYNPQIPVAADKSVNMQDAGYFDEIFSAFEVESMSRPLDAFNDPKLLKTFLLSFKDHYVLDEVIEILEAKPEIEYAEKVPMYYTEYSPNDSLYNLINGPSNWNWHLDVINAEQAWDITQGSPDIRVAIVDNAIWSDHPDLADKIVAQRDVIHNTNSSNPPNQGNAGDWSHGTHCSGLATAITDNDIGVAGVGFSTSIIAVKAANNSQANGIYMYQGVNWAIQQSPDVISMSFGGSNYSSTEQNLVNSGYNQGIVFVAAAGNDNNTLAHYPSNYAHVISVAATDEDDGKAGFSNYNPSVDVSAPGGSGIPGPGGLLSTTFDNTSMGYYDYYSGTSMACPVVAGLVSLIRSVNPDITPDDVEVILEETCDNIDAQNPDYIGMLGAGRINAYQAVMAVPYQPEAQFETPVYVITPGATVDFMDMSIGLPDSWTWTFEGGSPSNSTLQNPVGINYNTAGTYDVTLTVENDYGTNTLTLQDYITVMANPTPFVVFAVSDSMPCIWNAVTFEDLTLYDPTAWLWEFTPSTVQFVNGSNETWQNPEVEFLSPGSYTISVTATNANGANTMEFEDFIIASGMTLPFADDFESGESSTLELMANENALIKIDKRASNESTYGLHFSGGGSLSGWSGGPTNTTPEQAWEQNTSFQASASVCNVDATEFAGVYLLFDLRQTFSLGNTLSYFRVLVNDTDQVADANGISNFTPETNEDPFVNRQFNLSDYAGSTFSLSFQSSCRLVDYFFAEGDNVFIDNIEIIGSMVGVDELVEIPFDMVSVFPNPANGVMNFDYFSNTDGMIEVTLTSASGQTVYMEKSNATKGKMSGVIDISNFKQGIYIFSLKSEKGISTQKLIVN
jgi:subtilisin family serine protease